MTFFFKYNRNSAVLKITFFVVQYIDFFCVCINYIQNMETKQTPDG